ncbi:TRAP transporter substrate-binding protein DctP [Neotabrizicola shimadae]|uniref:TRAP transporter substrate-binding protein DctP n=1 Tax=Neotabrizicola shimadae TaxID=2807096 RepID=A0A8G1ECY4_9RHOB|nr:TRAP transporter substrate-binding protein DctP [Neotabrizicola shimadae]QYZ69583.1 TRAP transporter substrate-binding protein DctP [Neotabrizicola shimadae]
MTHLGRLLATSILALAPSALFAQTELIFSSFLPPHDDLHQIGVVEFAEAIEKESGGTIDVTIPDTSLAPSDRQYEMVRDGVADMALISSGTVRQLVALNQLSDLPGMSPSSRAASIALWETYNKYFLPLDEFKGVKVLAVRALPGRQVLVVNGKPIESVDGFAGVKLWSPPGRLTQVAGLIGAVPVNSEFPELFEYVSKGTVDAVIITPASAAGARILDKATSYTKVPGGLGSLSHSVVISQERWDALDADQQAAVLRAAEGLSARLGESQDAGEAEVAEIVAKLPMTELTGDQQAKLDALFAGVVDQWKAAAQEKGLADPDEVIAFYKSVLDRELAVQQ